ncbi:MAG TPA: ABC transporter substrate-binding protein [Jatrophihabitans sp.]|jgi:polar amino acid transport system substrate-binding protein|uniref:ABC transporter substrate-binding protein n=1 Tax=Jatrophihabitans sp. TaxID=1932789 RepID=UPI002F033400
MRRSIVVFAGLAVTGSLALAGCAKNEPKSSTPTTSATVGAVSKDQAAADLLPASLKSSGKLIVGINVPYAPNEYKDPSGKIVGWEVDLLNAMATKLGVTPVLQESGFDNIIPSVKGGKFNIGMSSFTDNKTREAQVDFVNYYSAGTQWAAPAGKTVDPDNACGMKIAVQTSTTQETDDLPARSKACTAAGKKAITIVKIDSQDAVNQAVILGQAEAFAADSPITQYAVKQSNGKLALAGEIYGAAPYGFVVAKDAGTLKQALQKAVQSMIDDGTYKQVLDKWGVGAGGLTQATVNGAQS